MVHSAAPIILHMGWSAVKAETRARQDLIPDCHAQERDLPEVSFFPARRDVLDSLTPVSDSGPENLLHRIKQHCRSVSLDHCIEKQAYCVGQIVISPQNKPQINPTMSHRNAAHSANCHFRYCIARALAPPQLPSSSRPFESQPLAHSSASPLGILPVMEAPVCWSAGLTGLLWVFQSRKAGECEVAYQAEADYSQKP